MIVAEHNAARTYQQTIIEQTGEMADENPAVYPVAEPTPIDSGISSVLASPLVVEDNGDSKILNGTPTGEYVAPMSFEEQRAFIRGKTEEARVASSAHNKNIRRKTGPRKHSSSLVHASESLSPTDLHVLDSDKSFEASITPIRPKSDLAAKGLNVDEVDKIVHVTSQGREVPESLIQANSPYVAIAREHYGSKMFLTALNLLSDAEAAEDAVQDACLSILGDERQVLSSKPIEEWSSYLITVVKNKARDTLRRRQRQPSITISSLSNFAQDDETEPYEFASPSQVEDVVEPVLKLEEVHRKALQIIAEHSESDELLLIYKMYFLEGYSMSEIEERTGIPIGTVKTRVKRFKDKLMKHMEEPEPVIDGRQLKKRLERLEFPSSAWASEVPVYESFWQTVYNLAAQLSRDRMDAHDISRVVLSQLKDDMKGDFPSDLLEQRAHIYLLVKSEIDKLAIARQKERSQLRRKLRSGFDGIAGSGTLESTIDDALPIAAMKIDR